MTFIALFAALGVVYYFLTQNISLANMIGGICIGICLYVIALVTSEQIGRGDALLFMSTGIYIGFWNNVVLLILSCLLAAVYGGLYIFVTKSEKDHCLPFIPFVAAAYIILIICGGRVFSIAGI